MDAITDVWSWMCVSEVRVIDREANFINWREALSIYEFKAECCGVLWFIHRIWRINENLMRFHFRTPSSFVGTMENKAHLAIAISALIALNTIAVMRQYRIWTTYCATSAMRYGNFFLQLKLQIHSRSATLHLSISVHLAQEIEGSQTEMNTSV